MEKIDFTIIGGGAGGVYFAALCEKNQKTFQILEKSKRLGGIIDQETINGHVIPKGPRIFLHKKAKNLIDFCSFFQVYPSVIQEKLPRFLLSKSGLVKAGPILLLKHLKLFKVLFQKPKKHEESIKEFFLNLGLKHAFHEIIEPLCLGIWAQDPLYLSMDHLMGAIKKKEFFKKKSNEKGLLVFKKGFNELFESAKRVFLNKIHFGTECLFLEKKDDIWKVHTNLGTYESRQIVLATPFYETLKILSLSGFDIDEDLLKARSASIDVVTFYFSKKQKREKGTGVLIPKTRKFKSLGILFDSDFYSYQDCDILSVFIQDTQDPIKTAFDELKSIFGDLESYDKAILSSYPKAIFSCELGLFDKLESLNDMLEKEGIYLLGAYPKVGVCDVLDKTKHLFDSLACKQTDILFNKA